MFTFFLVVLEHTLRRKPGFEFKTELPKILSNAFLETSAWSHGQVALFVLNEDYSLYFFWFYVGAKVSVIVINIFNVRRGTKRLCGDLPDCYWTSMVEWSIELCTFVKGAITTAVEKPAPAFISWAWRLDKDEPEKVVPETVVPEAVVLETVQKAQQGLRKRNENQIISNQIASL